MSEDRLNDDGPETSEQRSEDASPEVSSANERAAQRTDKVANGIERLAFKLHDFGNWMMGFLR